MLRTIALVDDGLVGPMLPNGVMSEPAQDSLPVPAVTSQKSARYSWVLHTHKHQHSHLELFDNRSDGI